MRLIRSEPGALIASVLVHVTLIASGAWVLTSRNVPPEELASIDIVVDSPPGDGSAAIGVGRSPGPPVPVPEERPDAPTGGGQHLARPDSGKPGRGGIRPGERASNLSSSIDPLTLERDPLNHFGKSEVQRLRVGRVRRSKDDRRATPNPMQLEFVASGRGHQNLRRPVAATAPSRGGALGGVPLRAGTVLGGGEGDRPMLAQGSQDLGGDPRPAQGTDTPPGNDHRASAAIVNARPAVVQGRASVPASERGQASDTVDSRQRVAARVAGLLQASTLGGEAATGVGGDVGPSAPAVGGLTGGGSRSTPAGSGRGADLAADPGLQGFYRHVLSELDRVLEDAFPYWAIVEGRGGLVVFDLTLLEDGRVAHVAVVRPSGIAEYDQNVVTSVRKVASFGPVPDEFGARAVLRINWDSINPVIGRHGPGPGRRP